MSRGEVSEEDGTLKRGSLDVHEGRSPSRGHHPRAWDSFHPTLVLYSWGALPLFEPFFNVSCIPPQGTLCLISSRGALPLVFPLFCLFSCVQEAGPRAGVAGGDWADEFGDQMARGFVEDGVDGDAAGWLDSYNRWGCRTCVSAHVGDLLCEHKCNFWAALS